MNIAVNTRLLQINKLEGIGWFSNETIKRIVKFHPEHTFFFIFDRPYDESFIFEKNVIPLIIAPPTRHPILIFIWFQLRLPKILKKIKADIFLSPDGNISLFTKIPQIDVIHDINFFHNPKQLQFSSRLYYNYFFPKFAKKATRLLTVSEYSKQDICKVYNIENEKVTVCYNAANSIYKAISEAEKEETKQKYSSGYDYFVFVGALNPRKNIPGLLKSFEIFRNKFQKPMKLIIVGAAMHLTKEIDNALKTNLYKDNIIFTGRLIDSDLHKVVASAAALVYVPFFEGFGIPLVEAMSCEIPIIAGNTTSLPEVAGNAALMVDVTNHEDIAEKMNLIVENQEVRNELIKNGKIQIQKFSWDKSAAVMWNEIMRIP